MNETEFDNQLAKVVKIEARKNQKAFLQNIEKNILAKKKTNWMLAASVIFFMGIISTYFINKPDSTETLYEAYFSPYPNIIAPITRYETGKSQKEIAFENYELKNYETASLLFDEMLSKNINQEPELLFYKGISLMEMNKMDEAIAIFSENILTNTSWNDENLWYLTLAYIKSNNIELAKKTLLQLSNENENFKRDETSALLKSLKNIKH